MALAPAQSYSDPQAAAQYAYFASLFTEYDYSQPNGGSPPHATDGGSGGSSGVMSPVETVAASNFFNDDVSQVTLPTVTQQGVMSPVTPSPFMNNMIQGSHTSSGAPSPTAPLQQQHIIPSFGQETFQQYFNFDIPADMSLDLNATSPRSTHGFSQPMPVVDYNSQRTSPTQQIPYVPPVGAAHSGARRVGGSWRPPQPEFDSQAEHSPAGTWPYPVPARS